MADCEDEEDDWEMMRAMQHGMDTRDRDQLLRSALEAWHSVRHDDFGMCEIDTTHNCSSEGCLRAGAIRVVDQELRLYGCINSGLHHVCYAKTELCHMYYLGSDGSYFCLFSRAWIGQGVAKSYFGRGEDAHEGDTRSGKRGDDDEEEEGYGGYEDDSGDEAGGGGQATSAAPELGDAALSGTATNESGVSSYEPDGADIRDELNLLTTQSALLVAATETTKNAASFGMSVVTRETRAAEAKPEPVPVFTATIGAGGSSTRSKYKPGHSATNDTLTRKRHRVLGKDTLETIHGVIAPLFDKGQRRALSQHHHQSMLGEASTQITKYVRVCWQSNSPPNIHVRDAIYDACLAHRKLLSFDDTDVAITRRYAALAYETWKVIIKSPHFASHHADFRLKEHVLGLLYTVKALGMSMLGDDGITAVNIIPKDDFLDAMLPPQEQLADWADIDVGYRKQSITRGRNTLKRALSSIADPEMMKQAERRIREAYYEGTVSDAIDMIKIGEGTRKRR